MNTRSILAVLLAAVCLAAVAAPAAGQAEPAVGFGDVRSEVPQGDVATIDLRLQNTDAATLQVFAADRDYYATLRVRDRNGDGTVGVRFNTFRAAGDDPDAAFGTVDAADEADVIVTSHAGDGDVLDTGGYNLILSTSETRIASRLSLVPPGEATGSNTSIVPSGTPLPAADGPEPNASGNGTRVATGDHVRAHFGVRGLGGIVAGDAPARNLVFPADSAPGAQTTHAVSTSPNETVGVQSVTIDYRTDGSTPPRDVYRITEGDIRALGVDTTGDGYVDRSAKIAVQNFRTTSAGEVTITFDRPIDVGPDDAFLASYPVQNPDTTEAQPVTVTLAGNGTTHRDTGQVQYGPAGQGTLGYGVDLRIESTDRGAPTDPLAAIETAYDADRGALVADADTRALDLGEYSVTLSVGDAAPDPLPRANMTERATVVEPNAALTELSADDGTSRLAVAAETNLAPGNSLVIRVEAEGSDGGLSQLSNCVTTVDADGSVGCEFDLRRPPAELDVEVSIERNGTVIAGPVAYDERE